MAAAMRYTMAHVDGVDIVNALAYVNNPVAANVHISNPSRVRLERP
jgi:hypothetical protein